MSAPTGQAPPRPQVGFSPESPPASTLSTTPLVRAPARRDPRQDPEPGDLLELGGIVWRVTAADEARVTWDVVDGPCKGEKHSCPRLHWPRTTKARQVVHRDLKPANVLPAEAAHGLDPKEQPANAETTPESHPVAPARAQGVADRDVKPENVLPEREAKGLRALYQLRDGANRVTTTLDQILEASGLSPTTWQDRCWPALERQGLVTTWLDPIPGKGNRKMRRYELTAEGLAAAGALAFPDTGVGPVSGTVSARCRPGVSSGLPSKSNGEAKKEEQEEAPPAAGPDTARDPVSAPVSGIDGAALLAVVQVIGDAVKAMADQTRATHVLIELLAARLTPQALPPCPRCQAPQVIKDGRNGPFPACTRFPDCKPATKSRTSTREAAEAARAEIEAADERARVEQAARTRALLERQAADQEAKQARLFSAPTAPTARRGAT